MTNDVIFNPHQEIAKGVDKLADAVQATLGPSGKNVLIYRNNNQVPLITKDGVTVARNISLSDQMQNIGALLIKEVAGKSDVVGDGPQPLNSKILTPYGFVKMGDIKVGDIICGTDNSTQEVLGVFPKGSKEVYEITFSDKRVVQCCSDHLWSVVTYYGSAKTITTLEMSKDYVNKNEERNRYKYYVPLTSVTFDENKSEMPLDPYLVGLLLGDGSLTGTGSIELSLGINKTPILDKIILPDGFLFNATFIEAKNYYRVKLSGKNKSGQSIFSVVESLGLLGRSSKNKFIPKSYLYSSEKSRKALLRGLLDTDGYINSRGLFEFSTVSNELCNDFLELIRSLGIESNHRLHTRDNDENSYSDTPIHRITELKGYNNGLKIVNIRSTGIYTEMQCIKVSNFDQLYITDNFIPTHNTTTATVLARAIYKEALKYLSSGHNPIDLKREIDLNVDNIIKNLESKSRKVETYEDLLKVAKISTNNDEELATHIATAINKVGINGFVSVEDSKTSQTTLRFIEGLQMERGIVSSIFFNQPTRQKAVYDNPNILILNHPADNMKDLWPVLEHCHKNNEPLIIFAEEFEDNTLMALAANKDKAGLKLVCLHSPGSGDYKQDYLEDLAKATGATIFQPDYAPMLKQFQPMYLGRCEKIVCDFEQTSLTGLKDLTLHIQMLNMSIENCDDDLYKEKLKDRHARLTNSIAVLSLGSSTQTEQQDKKLRAEDARKATRAALKDGILPGGGIPLFRSKLEGNSIGIEILNKALEAPIRAILGNAGANVEEILLNIKKETKFSYGYDARTSQFGDLYDLGVIDAFDVVVTSIRGAAAGASMLITTSCVIIREEEKK